MGSSHIYSPESLSNTLLSQGCILEVAPSAATVARMHIPKTGEG